MSVASRTPSLWGSLSKLASPGPRKAASSKGKAAPPEDALASFVAAWTGLQGALTATSELPLGQSAISRHLGQLLALLVAEGARTGSSEPLGACHEFLLRHGVLAALVALVARDEPRGARRAVIAWAKHALVALGEGFIVHSAVHRPLVKLLRLSVDCPAGLSNDEEEALVDIMATVSARIRKRPELLAIFFREKAPSEPAQRDAAAASASASATPSGSRPASPTPSASTEASTASRTSTSAMPRRRAEHDFLLFAFLLRFVHREGTIGDLARAGLVTLVDVAVTSIPSTDSASPTMTRSDTSSTITALSSAASASQPVAAREARLALGEYLLDSDFAEVLGAGLGALYGLLPGKLLVRPAGGAPSAGAWDDDSVEQGPGGMVLGGMGALEDEDDPDEVRRKRTEEEARLLALGVGLSDSSDFRDGLDGWLKLVEFTQTVLERTPAASSELQPSFDDDELADGTDSALAREQRLITSALQSSILGAVKTLFLPVLYTSILECSETDGSAVAVLSYLDALLAVVDEGGALETAILGFLMGEEDAHDSLRKAANASELVLPSKKRVKRRKSSALVLLESRNARTGPGHAPASAYFTSLGRFSLKDLLASTVHSSSSATSSAALKLLHTALSRHDRWSMGLLDVVLDEGATYFPSALRDDPPEEPHPFSATDTDSDDNSDDNSDVFVYPTSTPTSHAPLQGPRYTPSRLPGLLLGTPLPSTPSISHHLDSIDTLLDLLESIDPSGSGSGLRNPGEGGAATSFSTGFASYVQDAEAALAADAGFQRGVAAGPTALEEAVPTSSQTRRRSTLFGAAPSLSARDFAAAKTAYRHRLEPNATLLGLLLASLAEFFSHPPDVNLSLTAVLSKLALCPYRSLDGWMLPVAKDDRLAFELAGLGKSTSSATSDDGDDRSVDHDVDDLSRHDALYSPTPAPASPPRARPGAAGGASLLAIVSALSTSVAHFRATIPDFDRYLGERRAGLHFVDNLADALDGTDDGGNAFEAAVKGLGARDSGSPALPELPHNASYGLHLSPGAPTTPVTERDEFLTPPRRAVRREPSTTSFASTGTTTTVGVASPFSAHYRHTGSITLTPAGVRGVAPGVGDDDEGAPDSPTKRLSPAPPSVFSDESDPAVSPSRGGRGSGAVTVTVTLSTTLDNVLVLEEFVKELTATVLVRRGLGIDRFRCM